MKKRFWSLLLAICFLLALFPVPANAANTITVGPLTFSISGGAAKLTACDADASGVIEIPDIVSGYPVTELGTGAFASCQALEIVIPEGVKKIGDSCFAACFTDEIVLPSTAETIGVGAFADFRGSSVDLSAAKLTSIPARAFWDSFPEEILLPDTVSSIGENAFRNCQIQTITLPDGLKSIGDGTFSSCSQLKSVEIPSGVSRIGAEAFSYCDKLTELSLPSSLKTLGERAFDHCTSLEYAVILTGLTAIPERAFSGCSKLEAILIPDSVRTIGESAFSFCSQLQEIRIPKSVPEIPHDCFRDCVSLQTVWMTSSVKKMAETAFDECNSMQDLYFYGSEAQFRTLFDPEYVMPQSGLYHTQVYLIDAYPDAFFGFFDMPEETNWAYDGIAFCLGAGLMNGMGDGWFEPNGVTTRAQLVTILWRMCGEPDVAKSASFSDTQKHWAKKAISWASENGIVNGMGNNRFVPDAAVTREQLVTIFHRFCKDYLKMFMII